MKDIQDRIRPQTPTYKYEKVNDFEYKIIRIEDKIEKYIKVEDYRI